MNWTLPIIFGAALVAGCANRTVTLSAPFDAQAARRQLVDGTNVVRGSALIRQVGGGIVTCAGNPVFLMPASPTANEWATQVYGSPAGGFRSASRRGVMFDKADEFMSLVKTATCDPQGTFKFDKVADGQFLVFTRIVWRAGSELQGGSVMRPVLLTGGSTAEVVLSPSSP